MHDGKHFAPLICQLAFSFCLFLAIDAVEVTFSYKIIGEYPNLVDLALEEQPLLCFGSCCFWLLRALGPQSAPNLAT